MELSEHSSSPPADNPTCTDTENGKQNPEAAEEQETLAADEETQLSGTQSTDVGDSIDNDNNINKRKAPEGEGGGGKGGLHPLWKTSLCSFFRRQSGSCSHGDTCRYAHGEAELRPRPDKSWDPTSERAKKLLKSDSGERVEAVPEAREDVLLSVPQSDEADPSDTDLSRCIVHLPQKWTSENLKSFLDTQRVLYKTAKKKKGMTVGFIGFEDAEQITNATEVLDGKSMGNKHLKVANVILRSHEKKPHIAMVPDRRIAQPTKNHSGNGDPSEDPSGLVENEDVVDEDDHEADGSTTKVRSARDVVTPLAHMPYIDQLENKKNSLIQTLKRLTRNARKACPDAVPLPEWIHKSREIGGLPCKLEGILESPLVDGYRNKCEFSVGYSRQGKQTVGFMLGNFREGVTAVEEPVDCPNVSRISCKYASIFQEFLQSSPLPVWNRIDNTGFWRQLTVREGRSLDHSAEVENAKSSIAEVMLIVQVCSSGVNNELVTGEFQRMAKALAHGASTCSPPLPLTALVVQDHKGISNAAPSDSPLLPLTIPEVEDVSNLVDSNSVKTRIHDYISSLRFSISPTAFFQVNTLAAEKLYSLAGDWAGLDPDTLLFDICCGTGTIGLTLAHRVGMVVGIEMNASAVSDAQRNAEINGIKNCRFICAKAEDVMGSLLREYLSLPPQKDKTLHVSESESNKDIGDKDNVAHDDKVHSQDSFASNSDALVNDENVETKLDYSADRSNGSSEVAQLPMEAVDSLNAMEESTTETSMSYENSNHNMASTHIDTATLSENSNHKMASISIDASMPNVNLDQEMADVKSTQGGQQSSLAELKDPSENCISEENVSSPIPGRQFKNVVAIVDPPRVGLHPIVIKALRTHPHLRRLVYISCNPESLVANAIELCTPSPDKPDKGKNNRGWRNMSSAGLARHRTKSMPNSEPFRPVKAMAVDLFPHTPHCELVMLLDR